jgi:hypothetical protein
MKLYPIAIGAGLMLSGAVALAAARKPANPERPLPTAKAAVTDTEVEVSAQDEPRKVAEAYLQALARKGSPEALETLLGGATLMARAAVLENWKIAGREKHRHEVGQLEALHGFVEAIDAAGRQSLAKLSGGGGGPGVEADSVEMNDVTAEDATKILQPTRARAKAFMSTHPVFAYVARVDKPIYWHPNNPFRKLLSDAGAKGEYQTDLDLFWIETAKGKAVRKWPLRVVRFQAGTLDTGLRILPASDWNAE